MNTRRLASVALAAVVVLSTAGCSMISPQATTITYSPAEGVNIATRHRKPSQANPQGGMERTEAPLHISKVAHVTADGKPTRVRFEVKDGKKVRVAVKSGEKIDG